MSADFDPNDPDGELEEEYFSTLLEGAELTGKEPKFVRIESMSHSHIALGEMKVDDLIQMYRDARDQLATDRKGYKAREGAIKTHLAIISMILRDRADQLGHIDSFVTPVGTAYRRTTEKFSIPNWPELVEYIKETGNFQVLQKRVSPNAVKDIRTEEGSLPPGIEAFVEIDFAVRSPTARKKSK